jgi:hypothetical protein
MVGIGLYIRLGILETPTVEEKRVERTPVTTPTGNTLGGAELRDCAILNQYLRYR